MDHSNHLLCWFHEESFRSSTLAPCTKSTSCDDSSSTIPECHKTCTTYSRTLKMFQESGMPETFWDYFPIKTPESDCAAYKTLKHIREQIVDFVDSGQNLFLYSKEYGNGKTLWSSILMKAYIREQTIQHKFNLNFVRYVYIPDFIFRYMTCEKYNFDDDRRRSFFNKLYELSDTNFVIWDGFGYGSHSNIEDTVIRSVIHSRLNKGMSNMFISDKEGSELSDIIGESLFNRIMSCSIPIEFKSEGFRQTQF